MEERKKLVGRMWDMYTRTGDEVRLPRFWQEAFEAAYEELAGDDMQVRDAAISEIARMSAHRLELEQPVNEVWWCQNSLLANPSSYVLKHDVYFYLHSRHT